MEGDGGTDVKRGLGGLLFLFSFPTDQTWISRSRTKVRRSRVARRRRSSCPSRRSLADREGEEEAGTLRLAALEGVR